MMFDGLNKKRNAQWVLLMSVFTLSLGCMHSGPHAEARDAGAHHSNHHNEHHGASLAVVPAHERQTEAAKRLAAPTENKGIEAVIQLGETDLGADFPALSGRALRAREIRMAPGAVVAAHTHEARPGVAYIVRGEVLEHRSDSATPILRKAGDVAFEYSGISHWWQNVSDEPVHAFVVDVIEQTEK